VAAVDGVVLEPGGGVLAPHHQLVGRVVGRVGAEAAQDGVLQLRPRGTDRQHDRRLLLAGGQGDDLVHLLVDAAGLIHDRQREVQAFEALGDGGEDVERRAPGRDGHVVVVQLHPGFELWVELHHPGSDPERQPRLPLIGGHHHHHLGALYP
jgi:hypothetical protein